MYYSGRIAILTKIHIVSAMVQSVVLIEFPRKHIFSMSWGKYPTYHKRGGGNLSADLNELYHNYAKATTLWFLTGSGIMKRKGAHFGNFCCQLKAEKIYQGCWIMVDP